jgi:hypothetical protein
VSDSTPRKTHRLRFAILTFVSVTQVAHAGWQYTQWGMTDDQVIAASQGAVLAVPPKTGFSNGSSMRAEGLYVSSAGKFEANFIFDKDNRLIQVNLGQMDAVGCSNTRRLLTEKYGPAADSQPRLAIWRDEKPTM